MNPENQVLTTAQMRAAEQARMAGGTDEATLMERAGSGAADWIWRIAAGRTVTVLCGKGNNGGDGYVIARVLAARGAQVRVVAPEMPSTDVADMARKSLNIPVENDASAVSGAVLVDCLFGAGLSRPLDTQTQHMLSGLAARHPIRIAVDLPSGIAGDTGAILADGIAGYDATIATGAWKPAHFLGDGAARMGQLLLAPIDLPMQADAAIRLARPRMEPPEYAAHKYSRGMLAVVGGKMPGAALMASRAAMHAGPGYVKLVSDHAARVSHDLVLESDLDPVMEDDRLDTLLIGPGLGRDGAAKNRLKTVLKARKSVVIDADALHLLDESLSKLDIENGILTPHEGELAALCQTFGISGKTRVEKASELARRTGCTVIAKGPGTVIAAPDGKRAFADPATSWLSVAGTGDVLAGIAAARLACGRGAFDAACEAVWLHGEAARRTPPPFGAAALAEGVGEAYRACL